MPGLQISSPMIFGSQTTWRIDCHDIAPRLAATFRLRRDALLRTSHQRRYHITCDARCIFTDKHHTGVPPSKDGRSSFRGWYGLRS